MPAGTIENYFAWVIQLLLILVRVSTLFLVTPFLSRVNIPNLAKIGLALLTAFVLINIHRPPAEYPYTELWPLLAAIIREAGAGLVMGFVTALYFNIVYTAGHIIDMQIGFSMAQTFDVTVGGQVAVTAGLLNIVMTVSFIFADGISKTIYMLGAAFEQIPAGSALLRPELVPMMTGLFAKCFVLSIQVAMPVLASALLTEVALGVVVRTAPQMNVFVVGIPIKVLVGLIIFAVTIPAFVGLTGNLFTEMFASIDELLGGMIP